MALRKRPREPENGAGAIPERPAQQAKRRRLMRFGLGLLSALVDKVVKATASVFGGGGER